MNVTANGIRMHYALEGPAGAPVVTLSHSLAARLEMWEPQVKALAGRWRVLRYDTRGHGGSDAPAGPYTLDELAEDARALLGALGISTTHWVGLSMGGMIGQTLALKAPELFASLVLCDTTSRVPPEAKPQWEERIRTADTEGMESLVEPTLGRWFTPPFRERQPEVVERDPGTPVAAARLLHERIKGSELVVLKSASHLSNPEQPELFSGALTDFLGRVH